MADTGITDVCTLSENGERNIGSNEDRFTDGGDNRDNFTNCVNNTGNNALEKADQKEKERNEEKKIFVGGIGWDTNDEDLKTYFGQFGEVAHAQVKYDHYTGRSRGFAFVEFSTANACREALSQRDREIKGKKCEVKPAKSRENKKVFIGGLPSDFEENELRLYFEQYGQVEEIEWPFDKSQSKKRNFAFVVFQDEEGASRAAANSKQQFGDRLCDVKIAVPQHMRPHKQATSPGWSNYQGVVSSGWGDYGNYNAYSYAGYGGGGYYDDRYTTYDYGGYTTPAAGDYNNYHGYDAWSGYTTAGSPAVATIHTSHGGPGGGYKTGYRAGGAGGNYGSYY